MVLIRHWLASECPGRICLLANRRTCIYRWILVVDKLAWASCSRVRHDTPLKSREVQSTPYPALHLETKAKEAECVVAEIVFRTILFARMLSFGFNHFIVDVFSFIQQRHLQG